MKVKNIILLICSTIAIASCDTIEDNERYVLMEAVETKRNVLLEDFTGQNCPNCPNAHETASKLKQQYGDALITVSIHAGPFAWAEGSRNFPTFKTEEGDSYAAPWDIKVYPSGVINRTSGKMSYSDWANYIRTELQKDVFIDIETNAVYNEDSTVVNIATTLKPMTAIEGKLQIWVTESGIISRQKNGSIFIKEYEHNHVYRASVNGIGGEEVSLNANIFSSTNYTFDVEEEWNAKNLSVVVFVYNDSGVLQVVEKNIN